MMILQMLSVFIALFLSNSAQGANLSLFINKETDLKVPEIISKYGYPVENHYVTTKDGYILNLHRIPYGKDQAFGARPIVYIQHGVLSSSADWIIAGPEKGLAFVMADAGYDVWLGNSRGNRYSRNHTSLDPDRDASEFWNFSWHEMGIYDLPAAIDYALDIGKQKRLFYIGHSQGTTVYYVMASQLPEYNSKVTAHFSMAPIAYVNHLASPMLMYMALFQYQLEFFYSLFGKHEFAPTDSFMHNMTKLYCQLEPWKTMCANSLFMMCGYNPKQFNMTLLPTIMVHTPAGAATKQFMHYTQEINSGMFRQFDFGYFGNWINYNSAFPPKYNLAKVSSPGYFLYSRNDWLSSETDVLKLYKEIGNPAAKILIQDPMWNHLDYMWGIEAVPLVYNKIITLMMSHVDFSLI